jgi:hypothetical protein
MKDDGVSVGGLATAGLLGVGLFVLLEIVLPILRAIR